jgi:hypothetical protein
MSLSQREHISGRQGTVPYKKIYLICPIDVFLHVSVFSLNEEGNIFLSLFFQQCFVQFILNDRSDQHEADDKREIA